MGHNGSCLPQGSADKRKAKVVAFPCSCHSTCSYRMNVKQINYSKRKNNNQTKSCNVTHCITLLSKQKQCSPRTGQMGCQTLVYPRPFQSDSEEESTPMTSVQLRCQQPVILCRQRWKQQSPRCGAGCAGRNLLLVVPQTLAKPRAKRSGAIVTICSQNCNERPFAMSPNAYRSGAPT